MTETDRVLGGLDDPSLEMIQNWLGDLRKERNIVSTGIQGLASPFPSGYMEVLSIVSGHRKDSPDSREYKNAMKWKEKVEGETGGEFNPVVLFDLMQK